ncbi:MAG: c-type cytochrome, partial [Blastocatellia bacterium]
ITACQSQAADSSDPASAQYDPNLAAQGKELYEVKYQCQACHTIGSTGGYVGPSLTNAGNWLNPAWIKAWLQNPQLLVPGSIEPRRSFTEPEIDALTAYLMSLKQAAGAQPGSPAIAGGGAAGKLGGQQ